MTDHEIYRAGTHSGFPPCCVNYYIEQRRHKERYLNIPRVETLVSWAWNSDFAGYSRCPDCVSRDAHVKVHICDPRLAGCHEFLVNNTEGQLKRRIQMIDNGAFNQPPKSIEFWLNAGRNIQ